MKRFDYAKLTVNKTDEGYFIDSPILTRSGIFEYLNPNGTIRREYRPPSEVFNNDSLRSLLGKPITIDHPKQSVDKDNVAEFTVGTVLSEGRADNDGVHVRADIIIHQPDRCGSRRELSLGYDLELDETPGEIDGQRYDAIQRKIHYNHLSVVRRARAGQQARLNLDNDEVFDNENEGSQMPKVRLDNGIEYEAPAEVIAHVDALKLDVAKKQTALDSAIAEKSKVEAERDSLKTELAGVDAKVEKARLDALEQATQRADLEAKAAKFNVDCSGKTDVEIKKAVILSANKGFNFDGKDDAYVNARFDITVETRTDANMADQRKKANGHNEDSDDKTGRVDSKTAYDKHMESLASGNKGKGE